MNCISCGSPFDIKFGSCARCGWDVNSQLEPTSGYRIGKPFTKRYLIKRVLGSGRLGVSILATDQTTNLEVVIKVIHPGLLPNSTLGQAFITGTLPLLNITHPSMAHIIDISSHNNKYFVVSQFDKGLPLGALIEGRQEHNIPYCLEEIFQAMENIVQFLSDSGVGIHGSLSPKCIFIQPDESVKIRDAAIAINLPQTAVSIRMSSIMKTSGYAAPEIRKGQKTTVETDVYSLGVIITELLTLKPVTSGIDNMLQGSNVSEDLQGILKKATNPDPLQRFGNTQKFLAELANIICKEESTTAAVASQKKSLAPQPLPTSPEVPEEPDQLNDSTVKVAMNEVIAAHTKEAPKQAVDDDEREALPPGAPSTTDPYAEQETASPAVDILDMLPRTSEFITDPAEELLSTKTEVTQEIDLNEIEIDDAGTSALEHFSEPAPVFNNNLTPTPNKAIPQVPPRAPVAKPPIAPRAKKPFANQAPFANGKPLAGRTPLAGEEPLTGEEPTTNERPNVGINPRFLRAAASLEKSKKPKRNQADENPEEDDWRERIHHQSSQSVVSFLPTSPSRQPKKTF